MTTRPKPLLTRWSTISTVSFGGQRNNLSQQYSLWTLALIRMSLWLTTVKAFLGRPNGGFSLATNALPLIIRATSPKPSSAFSLPILPRSNPHMKIVFFLIKPVCICRQLSIDWLIIGLKSRLGRGEKRGKSGSFYFELFLD